MNKSFPVKLWLGLILLAGFLLPYPALAQAQVSVGRIITTAGIVSAVDPTGASRPLARGSELYVGETLTTGADGAVELRMNDGAMVSMTEDAQFIVNNYQNDGPGGAADTAVMTVLRGAMRTISGAIGKTPGDTYSMNTPYASIGIRGTEYAVRVTAGGRTFVIVFDGGITLAPAGGGTPVDLGVGGTADAVELEDGNTIMVVDVAQAPPEVQALVELIVEEVSEEQVNLLPPPDEALEAQLENLAPTVNNDAPLPTVELQPEGGGQLVDVAGNAFAVTTEVQTVQARQTVVISITSTNPDAFTRTTLQSVSGN